MTQGDQTSARRGEVLLCDKSLGDEVRTDSGNCINMMIIIIPNMMMIRIAKNYDHLLQNLPRAVTSTWRLSKQLPSTPLLGAFDNICFFQARLASKR